jgi:hypothetical protein
MCPYLVELRFHEAMAEMDGARQGLALRTIVHVTIRPKRKRDRRQDAAERASQLLISLKSYLMAQDYDAASAGQPKRADREDGGKTTAVEGARVP